MKKKHILIIACILSVFLSTAFVYAADEDEGSDENATSGICGKDVTWVLDDEGTLTIEGTGSMDYTRPWMDERGRCDDLKNIVIKGSVTVITEAAFYGCVNLESVELNNGLKTIEKDAFSNCGKLTDVELPDGLQTIEDRAFGNCGSIKKIKLPIGVNADKSSESTYKLIYGPFAGSGLETVTFSEGETIVSADLCAGCESLTNVILPDSLREIKGTAFYGCKSLNTIVLPDSLKYVGTSAFGYCNLKTINIPNGLNSDRIIHNPFSESGIEHVTFAEGTTEIAPYLFEQTNLKEIVIPKGVTKIGNCAFYQCGNVENIELNNELEYVGIDAFKYVGNYASSRTRLEELILPDSLIEAESGSFSIAGLKKVYIHKNFKGNSAFENTGITDAVIEDGTEVIPEKLFYNCKSLKNVNIPDSVKTIEKFAFFNCQSIENISLPDGLEKIGDGAFRYCKTLPDITIPDSVEIIGDSAFSQCNNLKQFTFPKNFDYKESGRWIFAGSGIERISFNCDIDYIHDHFYSNCPYLESITIPESVTEIGENAFSDCEQLKTIKMGNSIRSIGREAFLNCVALENIEMPVSLKKLGARCFVGCENLKTIKLPELDSGAGAFTGSYIETVSFYDNVKYVPSHLFENAKRLNEICWTDSIKTIGANAFDGCDSIKTLKLPSGLENIEGYAFINCKELTTIYMPESIKEIDTHLFYNSPNVDSVIIQFAPFDLGLFNEPFYNYSGDIYFTKTDPYWDRDTRIKWAPKASWRNKDCVVLDASYKTIVSEDGTKADTSLTSKDTAYSITEILNDEPEEVEVKAIGKSESNITETTIEIPRDIVAAAVKTGCSFTYTTNTGRVNIDKASVKGALRADTARVKFELDSSSDEYDLASTYDAKLYNINVAEEEVQVEELDGMATYEVKAPAGAKKGYVVDCYMLHSDGSETFIGDTVYDGKDITFEAMSVGDVKTSLYNLNNAKKDDITTSPKSFTYNGDYQKFTRVTVKLVNEETKKKVTIPNSSLVKDYKNNKVTGNKAQVIITGKKYNGETIRGSYTRNFTIKIAKASKPTVTVGVKKMTIKMSKGVSSTGGTKYVYQYRKSGNDKWKTASKTTKRSVTVRKLKSGKRYQVRVCAVKSGCADGNYSTTVTSGKIRK